MTLEEKTVIRSKLPACTVSSLIMSLSISVYSIIFLIITIIFFAQGADT